MANWPTSAGTLQNAALNHLHETQRNRQDSSDCRTGSAERSIKTSFIFIQLYKFTKWFDCRINRHWCQSILKGHFVFLFDVVINNVCRLHPACNCYRSIQSNSSFVVDTFVKIRLFWQHPKMGQPSGRYRTNTVFFTWLPLYLIPGFLYCITLLSRSITNPTGPFHLPSYHFFMSLYGHSHFYLFYTRLPQFLALKYESWGPPGPRFSHTTAKESMSDSGFLKGYITNCLFEAKFVKREKLLYVL